MHTHTHTHTHAHLSVYSFKQELSIGVSVYKRFGVNYYHGVIVSSDVNEKGKTLWHVKHDDSDEEDLYDDECRKVVRNHRKLR